MTRLDVMQTKEAKAIRNAMIDMMWKDIEKRMKKMGVGVLFCDIFFKLCIYIFLQIHLYQCIFLVWCYNEK